MKASRSGLAAFAAWRPTSAVGRAVIHAALHERILFFYVVGLLVAVAGGRGEGRVEAAVLLLVDLLVLSTGIVAVRAPVVTHRLAVALVARGVVLAGIVGTFLQLHIILPATRRGTVDARLHALDLRLFGFEPASALDRWVSPPATEWFSFFYVSYFVILAVHVLPFTLLERRLRLLGELTLGMVAVYCIGQLVYVVVPGFGPYKTLSFAHVLEGPTWWPLVQAGTAAVDQSKRTDIFPSLHTAGPVFLALFSFRHRRLLPFRYTWPIVAFFALQIIGATMFLRWHYLIDVLAGIALAVFAARLSASAGAEEDRRAAIGIGPIWTPLSLVRGGT
jgi:PAP2 superfamily